MEEATYTEKEEIQFKFDGKFDSIDMEQVLRCQLNMITIIKESAKRIVPEAKISIDVRGTKKGSLGLESIIGVFIGGGIFVYQHKDVILDVLKTVSEIYQIKTKFKNIIPKFEKQNKGNMFVVYANNSPGANIQISGNTVELYNNSVVRKAVNEVGDSLEKLSDKVDHYKVFEKGKKKAKIDLPKSDFKSLTTSFDENDETANDKVYQEARLNISKPDLFPKKGKKWDWKLIHKGREISATIKDDALLNKINEGLRVAQGDIIVADLTIKMKFDKRLNTFVEGQKIVENIIQFIPRSENDGQYRIG